MPPIINAQNLIKAFGSRPLFEKISFTLEDGDRIGMIGPNGAGKSTLLHLLAGQIEPDDGEVAIRRATRIAMVEQESRFNEGESVRGVIESALRTSTLEEHEREARVAETLGRAGFTDFTQDASRLSGGWRKRLALAQALATDPEVLLLDEPTNHLDVEGIEWLEGLLERSAFAWIAVSHDRYFLENAAAQIVELSRGYPLGTMRVRGRYSQFLEKKEEFLAAQAERQASLENKVRREIEWLRRGPKARTTKSKARTGRAEQMIGELADSKSRAVRRTADIEFEASERESKRLVEIERASCRVGPRTLFEDLTYLLRAKAKVGVVGPNGSGKTTLLRLISGAIQPTTGTVKRADALQTVYFEQERKLDPDITLQRALAPHGGSVVYRGRLIHIASWASRFLFSGEQLVQPVSRLSGGERARLLIARLMLEPADLLILDEPTNDLDIATLETLEESLLEFEGALLLVTHDRYLLDRVCDTVIGLDGRGGIAVFADYRQWEEWRDANAIVAGRTEKAVSPKTRPKTKLSYLEQREFDGIEQRILEAEQRVKELQEALAKPEVATDAEKLVTLQHQLVLAEQELDVTYARWAELENKVEKA